LYSACLCWACQISLAQTLIRVSLFLRRDRACKNISIPTPQLLERILTLEIARNGGAAVSAVRLRSRGNKKAADRAAVDACAANLPVTHRMHRCCISARRLAFKTCPGVTACSLQSEPPLALYFRASSFAATSSRRRASRCVGQRYRAYHQGRASPARKSICTPATMLPATANL
jgi:hypothetical protein